MSDELRACPFCGGKAEINPIGAKQLQVRCSNCLVGLIQKVKFKSMEWLRQVLVEKWNTRTK